MPQDVLRHLGSALDRVTLRFVGAYYFHGTRALEPEDFRERGILPLDAMLEDTWATLRTLVSEELSNEEWAAFRSAVEEDERFGHDGHLYRLKTRDPIHYGPHGELVREVFLDPRATSSHDYLDCPEIVQDIARCHASTYGLDLERRFVSASKPCIVKFRGPTWPGMVPAALWFAYHQTRNERLGRNVCGGFAGEGTAVPPEDVVGVEVITSWRRRYS